MKNLVKAAILMLFGVLIAVTLLDRSEGMAKKNDQKPPKRKNHNSASVDPSQFVGSETCQTCHEEIHKHYERTAHFKTLLYKNWPVDRQGCEACHGPGKAHVESGGDKTKILSFTEAAPGLVTDTCLKCHEEQTERSNFRRSEHNVNSVTCIACHSSHHPKRIQNLLREESTKLCLSCHGEVKTDFAMPFHHKVPEGNMKCVDCHNQHGGFNPRQVRASMETDVICIKCHSDKQGPFVFEHAPIKVEGCTACHVPHGATNARMLRRNEVRFVCLECHSNVPGIPGERRGEPTPAFHNLALPRWQSCTTCHANIHGSNLSRVFFE